MTAKQVLLVRLDVFAKQRMTGALGDANVDDITRFNLAIRRLGEDRSFKLVASPREVVFVAPALAVNQNPTSAPDLLLDRKSTRLNSSHVRISYAVFCLKKK